MSKEKKPPARFDAVGVLVARQAGLLPEGFRVPPPDYGSATNSVTSRIVRILS